MFIWQWSQKDVLSCAVLFNSCDFTRFLTELSEREDHVVREA